MATFSTVPVAPTQTATIGTYIPPFATGGGGGGGGGGPGAVPTTSTSPLNDPNPTTPAYIDDYQWVNAYLVIHKMSTPSYRYSFMLWLAVLFVFLLFAILHLTGRRGGFIGAWWSKFALRRRTFRKKHTLAEAKRLGQPHKQPYSLPSNAQILTLAILTIASLALCFIGPDYIAPGTKLWDFTHNTTLTRRDDSDLIPRQIIQSSPGGSYSIRTNQPLYTIPKAWWTVGGRTGIIAFALFPLCVLFALKAQPFALFAIPFFVQIHFDKLARLHRWTGWLIWFISALHIATWGVQLGRDRRGGTRNKMVWFFAWRYDKFIFGWVAFGLLTALCFLSLRPLRAKYYEAFYFLHIFLVMAATVFSALHFPPIWWWCWSAIFLWTAERIWRTLRWAHINGLFERVAFPRLAKTHNPVPQDDNMEMTAWSPPPNATFSSRATTLRDPEGLESYFAHNEKGWAGSPNESYIPDEADHKRGSPYSSVPPRSPLYEQPALPPPSSSSYVPPLGYAHVELLPGRTVRLRLITPNFVSWAPGQHFLILIPSISRITTHPFTAASVCDEQAPSNEGREILFLVRSKAGWTKDLWDTVVRMTSSGQRADAVVPAHLLPRQGVLLRTFVDGPYGTAVRARWGTHSTVVIAAGGSGVSFAMAVLEFMCLCMAGRDGKFLGGKPGGWGKKDFQTTRVRFLWLVREYSHLQWCAATLRRCVDMMPRSSLHIDVFVTSPKVPLNRYSLAALDMQGSSSNLDELLPPMPGFAQDRSRRSSVTSLASVDSNGTWGDNASSVGDFEEREDPLLGHEAHHLDFTNFDGEDDRHLPGEAQLANKMRKTGKIKRAQSRKNAKASSAKHDLDQKVAVNGSGLPKGGAAAPVYPPGAESHLLAAEEKSPTSAVSPVAASAMHPPQTRRSMYATASSEDADLRPPSAFGHFLDTSHRMSYASGYSDISRPETPLAMHAAPAGSTYNGAESMRNLVHIADNVRLEISEEEAADLSYVSEFARTGRPKLDRILADEVERSRGSVIVACCGPVSFNAILRKAVAAQISPSRIMKSDMRGSISLVTEEYDF